MTTRVLLTTVRFVEESGTAGYAEAWSRVRDAVTAAGGKAWRYRSLSTAGRYVEFIEYSEGGDPRSREEVAEAMRSLNGAGRGDSEEWTDATTTINPVEGE